MLSVLSIVGQIYLSIGANLNLDTGKSSLLLITPPFQINFPMTEKTKELWKRQTLVWNNRKKWCHSELSPTLFGILAPCK